MTHSHRVIITVTVGLIVNFVMTGVFAQTRTPDEAAARAKAIAENFEQNARQLTVFDRQGRVVNVIGTRDMYTQPSLSSDNTRVAVIKGDLEKETADVWVLDAATGNGVRLTSNQSREPASTPVWSPDGSEVAYVALRGSYYGLYRKASNGQGPEELLYQHPGGPISFTGWSLDGRFLNFSAINDLSGGLMYALSLTGDRKAVVVARSQDRMSGSRLSPDSRFISYFSNESGRNEIWVRAFDSSGNPNIPLDEKWQVSKRGGLGMVSWRRDGRELYYFAADRGIMAVDVSTTPTFQFGNERLLFRAPDAIPVTGTPGTLGGVSRDGERVVFAVPPPPALQQITVLDRQGNVVSKVGGPGLYQDAALSPDGTRVAVRRTDPTTGNVDIWAFDVASGRSTPVTNGAPPENAPIWSPDSRQVAYVSTRGKFTSIYRKAWDGTGNEEQLFQYTPGAGMVLTDWSADGRFLTFYPGGGGFLILVVPLSAAQNALERKAIEWLREEYDVSQGRFSPDSRVMAYLSNEIKADTREVYVRPFDASQPEAGAAGAEPQRVSDRGARGMISWRQDGKELYYLSPNWEVMAVDVTTTPTLQAGDARVLFKLPGPLVGNPQQWRNVSRDGQRFVFVLRPGAASPAR